ncbi:MAG: DUF4125 family protein [Lachnospiraceae bacterium]|nr:DUF4125 family protein [Lachnospiraceae bacterium]
MNVTEIMEQVYALLKRNQVAEAEQLMVSSVSKAEKIKDAGSALQLMNELLGFYRETGQTQKSYETAAQALKLAENMGLRDTAPYATTLQNVANAYRAGGRLQDSLAAYEQAKEIYSSTLSAEDMLVASLCNNISLLYQEMGDFTKAKKELLTALQIVEQKGSLFEIAATYTNLSASCLSLGEVSEALAYARKSVEYFEQLQEQGTHYCGALTALGSCLMEQKQYPEAMKFFVKARELMEQRQERTVFYQRLQERIQACKEAMHTKGLELCRKYYETYGVPMLQERFGEYRDRIAVGLVGEGSDCFGFDDALSVDHDFGPGFCMWVTDETYEEIGDALQQAYEQLPREFSGYQRLETAYGRGRRGVRKIKEFYEQLIGTADPKQIDWQQVSDSGLAAAVNGEVFRDAEGIFSGIRQVLLQGYPASVQYLRLAQAAAEFAQNAQYNFPRMSKRRDGVTAGIMLGDGIRAAMKLQHYLENRYPVHDKWLYRSIQKSPKGKQLALLLSGVGTQGKLPEVAQFLTRELYDAGYISDMTDYLDAHTGELVFKSTVAEDSIEQLTEKVVALEFKAFDKVRNVGGRASCQDDFSTFSIMRKSQYLTWDKQMLMQYLYDFTRELERGHNLIEEKYGRMMESTAPEEYEQMKAYFPAITEEKKAIIEQIVQMQVAWMEEFAKKYPNLAGQARSVHSSEDHLYNTSYETYLRGEISTYSDKMLELY